MSSAPKVCKQLCFPHFAHLRLVRSQGPWQRREAEAEQGCPAQGCPAQGFPWDSGHLLHTDIQTSALTHSKL